MIIIAGLVIALGALVQGAVGYGMALVAAPLLALVDPRLVPVPLILLTSTCASQRQQARSNYTRKLWAMRRPPFTLLASRSSKPNGTSPRPTRRPSSDLRAQATAG